MRFNRFASLLCTFLLFAALRAQAGRSGDREAIEADWRKQTERAHPCEHPYS